MLWSETASRVLANLNAADLFFLLLPVLQTSPIDRLPFVEDFSPSNKHYDVEIRIRAISSAVFDPTFSIRG
jgi:hypothetical protein